jgi:hypothetical protein
MVTKVEIVNSRIETFASESGYGGDRAKGLEIYAARLFGREEAVRSSVLSGDDWLTADVSSYLCGNSGDGNIDGILFSTDSERVIAFQAKYRSKKWQETELLAEIEKLSGAYERLRNKSYRKEKLSELARDLVEDSGIHLEKKSVSLHLITNQTIGDFKQCLNRCKEITKRYESQGWDVSIEVNGAAEIIQLEESFESAELGSSVKDVKLNFGNKTFEYKTDDRRAVVGMLKGNTVSDLFNQHKDALFNLNVRGYLGGHGINKGIISTAEGEDAENFFYYNNGITATCSDLDELGKGSYIARDLQIVNGAQTVRSLNKALKDNANDGVFVLFRLIETGDSNRNKSTFANLITRYQNTQNKVLDSDFFANDKIQIWLERNFSATWSGKGKNNFVATFSYVRKRGFGSKGPGKEISIQELGKLRHAFLHGPKVAYREAKSIWSSDDTSRYAEAFGRRDEDGFYKLVDEWTNDELAEMAWAVHTWIYVQNLAKEAAKKSKLSSTTSASSSGSNQKDKNANTPIPEENYLRNLSFWVVAATAVALRAGFTVGKFENFEQIMRSEESWKDATSIFVKEARIILAREMKELYDLGQANPRLNLPGNDKIWNKTLVEMEKRGSIKD